MTGGECLPRGHLVIKNFLSGLTLTALPPKACTGQQREPLVVLEVPGRGQTRGAAPLPPRAPRTSAPGQSPPAGARDRGTQTALAMGSAV